MGRPKARSVKVGPDRVALGKTGLAKVVVHQLFQIIAPAVLEQQKLLGDQLPILGNTVEIRIVPVERLVGFPHHVHDGGGFPNQFDAVFVSVLLRVSSQSQQLVHHPGLVQPVLVSHVGDHFDFDSPPFISLPGRKTATTFGHGT